MSEHGGEVTEIQRPDSTSQETALRWPEFLPDGEHLLFVSLPPRGREFDVFVASIDAPGRRLVMRSWAAPVCAGQAGLIVTNNGRILSQRFDYRRLQPVGEPVSLGSAASADISVGQRLVSASANGVLVQPTASLANTRVVWLDRSGEPIGLVPLPEGRYESVSLSPDGRRILVSKRSSPTSVDLWMVDLEGGQVTRFTLGSQSRFGGQLVWSHDGSRVAFSSNHAGPTDIYQKPWNGAGDEELLFHTNDMFKEVTSSSPDGRFLAFEMSDRVTNWDIWLLPLEGERKPIPYLRTQFNEIAGCISPDGRWMAYSSNMSGRTEVYVRSFPTPGEQFHVLSEAGVDATWTQDGSEIVITNRPEAGSTSVWSVPITTAPTFKAGAPRLLFRAKPDMLWIEASPDGQRFLAVTPTGATEPTTIAVEVNWPSGISP